MPAELNGPVYGLVYGDHNTVTIVHQARPAPPPFLAPPLPPQQLVGRDQLTDGIAGLLDGAGPRLVALHGLPGVGKTTIATTLAHREDLLARYPDGVLWAGVGREPRPAEQLAAWAAAVGVEHGTFASLTTVEDMARAVHAVIGTRRMALFIDDVWTTPAGLLFKLGGPGCAHVFTSRLPEVAARLAGRAAIPVAELDRRDSLTLITQLAPSLAAADAAALIEHVGGLPLALTLMGRYIDVRAMGGQARRLREAVRQLEQAKARFELAQEQGPLDQHPSLSSASSYSLLAAIDLSYGWLSADGQAALRALGAFDAKPSTLTFEAAAAVTAGTDDALDELISAGLLQAAGDDRYALHQTITDFARSQGDDPMARRRMAEYYTELLQLADGDNAPALNFGLEATNVTTALGHVEADGVRYLALLDAAYPYLEGRGMYRPLISHLERAAAIVSAADGVLSQVRVLYRLGHVLHEQGDLPHAEQRLAAARAVIAAGGMAEPGVDGYAIDVATSLGWVLAMQGQVADGGEEFAAAVRLAEQAGQPARAVRAMHGVAWLARFRGEHDEARAQMRDSLALAAATGDVALVTDSLEQLGWTTAIGGDYDQAGEAFTECADLARAAGRQGVLIVALHGLGWLRLMRGQFAEAVPFLTEALGIATAIGHRERGSLLINLGWAERELGRYPEAEAAMTEALAISRAEGRLEKVSQGLKELGQLARERGDLAAAERDLTESLQVARQMQLADSTVGALQALGTLARQRGQAGEAKAFFDEAITMEQERGNPHMVAGLLRDLGLADADAGDTDAALAHLRQAHRVAVTVGDAETGGTALYDAAKLLLRTGDKAGARASALESATVLREGGHPRADEVTAWLAGLDQSTAG